MHFKEELADPGELSLQAGESSGKELDMARSLIDTMTDEWQPDRYHDEYADALMKVIEEKIAAGGKELPPAHRGAPPSTKVVDIVAMLQESLKQRGGGRKAAAEPKSRAKKRA